MIALAFALNYGLLQTTRMKEKHVWSAQVLDLLICEPSDAYMGSGSEPYWIGPMGESDKNAEFLQFMAPHSQ